MARDTESSGVQWHRDVRDLVDHGYRSLQSAGLKPRIRARLCHCRFGVAADQCGGSDAFLYFVRGRGNQPAVYRRQWQSGNSRGIHQGRSPKGVGEPDRHAGNPDIELARNTHGGMRSIAAHHSAWAKKSRARMRGFCISIKPTIERCSRVLPRRQPSRDCSRSHSERPVRPARWPTSGIRPDRSLVARRSGRSWGT